MIANGNSLLELINGILDLARIESGRLQIEKSEFDLTELIDNTISTFGVGAHTKGLELIARIAPGVPDRLIGDPLRLRQVLINLIGNAVKFTERGEVMLEVDHESRLEGAWRPALRVSDTGIGIPADKLDSIFASFTQADSSTTRQYGGTGLGLAIVKRLVGLMGGRIWVESEVNKGSRFFFTARFGIATRVISPTPHVETHARRHRVLVVDDNHINRLIVREMLSACGADVTEAASGADALEALRHANDTRSAFQDRPARHAHARDGRARSRAAHPAREAPDRAVDPDALVRRLPTPIARSSGIRARRLPGQTDHPQGTLRSDQSASSKRPIATAPNRSRARGG